VIQRTLDRRARYQCMADFGTCAVCWPLQEQYEKDIEMGKMPEL
jgi:hypothetical protein